MEYADGTYAIQQQPWGWYVKAAVMCPDGKVRLTKRIAESADTFFSVPCAITYKGRTVSGYMTCETRSGSSVATDDDPAVLKFVPYKYGRNGGVFDVS